MCYTGKCKYENWHGEGQAGCYKKPDSLCAITDRMIEEAGQQSCQLEVLLEEETPKNDQAT